MKVNYSNLDRQIIVADNLDKDGDIILGFGISSDGLPRFLNEIERVARECGAVPFSELLKEDINDEAMNASMHISNADRRQKEPASRINLSDDEIEII